MSKQQEGYRNLVLAVIKIKSDEELLPIRECDIQAIRKTLERLEERKLVVVKMLFGLDGEDVHESKEIDALVHDSKRKAHIFLGHALNQLRAPINIVTFMKLWRPYLESELIQTENANAQLRKKLGETEVKLQQELALKEINNDILFFRYREAHGAMVHVLIDVPIKDILFSVRSSRCLSEAGVITVKDLIKKTEGELLSLPRFGRKSLNEVMDYLQQTGFKLAKEPWSVVSQRTDYRDYLTP